MTFYRATFRKVLWADDTSRTSFEWYSLLIEAKNASAARAAAQAVEKENGINISTLRRLSKDDARYAVRRAKVGVLTKETRL